MSREGKFLIHCIECYRRAKNLSGAAVAELFSKYGLFDYIMRYFESLHVNGDRYLVEDFDEYIANHVTHTALLAMYSSKSSTRYLSPLTSTSPTMPCE